MPSRTPGRRRAATLFLLLAALVVAAPAHASRKKDKAKKEKSRKDKLREAYKEAVKDSVSRKGLLHLRQKEGKLYAELKPSNLKKDYLLLPNISRGVGEGFLLGGMMRMGQEMVLRFEKGEEVVRVVKRNIRFKAKKGTPTAEAVRTAFSDSVLASLKVIGLGPGGAMLVNLDDLLISDLLALTGGVNAFLGGGYGLDTELSRWESVKAYPENLELRAVLGFSGGPVGGSPNIPDPRYLQLGIHYSLIAMPDGKYSPRPGDDRVGHFLAAQRDYSRTDPDGPTVRYVTRWRLEKADAKADRSPVKEPIIYYIGRNVPYRWRSYIRAGILEWNKAFEKVGYLDAVEVRYQSDEDDWDGEDARYNTVRWALGNVPFGAIGPHHGNPLTGEILDADILFSGAMIAGFWRAARLRGAEEQAVAPGDELLVPEAPRPEYLRTGRHQAHTHGPGRPPCDIGRFMQREFALAAAHYLTGASGSVSVSTGAEKKKDGEKEKDKKPKKPGPGDLPEAFIGAALKYIAMHEVGHTLGLRHNFKASSIVPREKLHDVAWTREHGLAGSVMDYLPSNLAPHGKKQGEYFTSTIGAYDYWAIEYAYTPEKGEKALAKIAGKAPRPELAYASDEDRMALFDRNLDPLVHAGDLGDDPLAFAEERLALLDALWDKLRDRVVYPGRSYVQLRAMVTSLLASVMSSSRIAAVYVGGQYHHRDHRGDEKERAAFVPVEVEKQRKALDFLAGGVFSDRTYAKLGPELLNRLAPNHWWHWGASVGGDRLDYPIHRIVRTVQLRVLWRLLSPWVLERLLDGERQVPSEKERLGVAELLERLTRTIFAELETPPSEVERTARRPYISSYRRTLQRSYQETLGFVTLHLGTIFSTDAGAAARRELRALRKRLDRMVSASGGAMDVYSRAHLEDLVGRIDEVFGAERSVQGF